MAGTTTITRSYLYEPAGPSHTLVTVGEKVTFAWVSDASGNVNGDSVVLRGWLSKVLTDPGATAPTDNWDHTLLDSYGVDALDGALVDRDTANSEQKYPVASGGATPIYLNDTFEPKVANAGNAKVGTIVWILMFS